ncbi:MAG: glycerophosphodiester phosphodiesterase [Solirubrobacteraceae bacterium]
MDAFHRIGHGGASALAPGNTLAAFDAALEVGIDMVEFDVRRCGGALVLAHTLLDGRRRGIVTLEQALAHLACSRFDGIECNVDLKHTGCENELLDGLRRHGLLARTLISSQVPAVLDGVREREPHARLGVSVGGWLARMSRRAGDWRALVLAGLTSGRWGALMAQHRLVDRALLADVGARGGLLYAWTVNDRGGIERLRGLGVHGVVTTDPRLFSPGA